MGSQAHEADKHMRLTSTCTSCCCSRRQTVAAVDVAVINATNASNQTASNQRRACHEDDVCYSNKNE